MTREIKRITRCALCAWFMRSEHYGTWFCSLHSHEAGEHDGCTWGKEAKSELHGKSTTTRRD